MRFAGILSGTGIVLPSHTFGGTIRVDYNAVGCWGKRVVCMNVPAEVCQQLDTKYDDGVWNTGDIRGNQTYTAGTQRTLGWSL